MSKHFGLFFSILVLFFSPCCYATLNEALQDGQHILMMRHADAPGVGDPEGYRLGDCTTQRNLGALGQRQAKMPSAKSSTVAQMTSCWDWPK